MFWVVRALDPPPHTQGADHLLVISADGGRCDCGHPELNKAILLHHYGRVVQNKVAPCDLFSTWGGRSVLLKVAILEISTLCFIQLDAPQNHIK